VGAPQAESRKAFHELLDLLHRIDDRYLGAEWLVNTADDVGDGLRAVMHMLQGGLVSHFEEDATHPTFRRIVSPTRKFTGDNSDALYYDTVIRPDRSYVVRGTTAGAVYVSLTIEAAAEQGRFGSATCGVINDTQFDVADDGSFEVFFGGPERARNWIALPPESSRITTRHYFEELEPRAAETTPAVRLSIEMLEGAGPPAQPTDSSVAEGIRRVANFLESRTLGMGRPGENEQPDFVSKVPNELPKPVKPGSFALAAADAAYSMTLYMLGADQAMVIKGRWPECRCANIMLWNRYMQTYDFSNRQVSLNRKQTVLEDDGSFRIVLAHEDPGVPNWIDTEGRQVGLIFCRFMLPESDIVTPQIEVVAFSEVRGPGGLV
jgi:hypothetical protein